MIEAGVSIRNSHELGLRTVDPVAEDPAASGAMRVHLLAAVNAFTAGADAGNKNPVARLERHHGLPDSVDNANAFMAKNAPGLTGRDVTLEDVEVGATNRCPGYLDDGVGRLPDFRHWTLFHGHFCRAQINESFHDWP